jgi:thiosulfate reductase cytochrome b subunit
MSKQDLYLYPVWLRIWHGINALGIILLIVTGISMQYGNVDYPLLPFKASVIMHNIAGIVVSIAYVFFLISNHFSNNERQYIPNYKGFVNRLFIQAKYYLSGYFKGEPKPFPITKDNKFNPLQRMSYISVMYLFVPIVVITGIALLYPEMIFSKVLNYGGVMLTAILHASMGFFISLFLIIHLYVASIGKHPLRNYKSIINGYHAADDH